MVCLVASRFECKCSTAVSLSVKKWDQMNVFYKATVIPQSLCITETLTYLYVQLSAVRKHGIISHHIAWHLRQPVQS